MMRQRDLNNWRRRGRPLLAEKDNERCEAATVMTTWKKLNKREIRCPFMARWSVDGHLFCRQHAVVESFAIGVEKNYIKRLSTPPIQAGQRVPIATSKQRDLNA